MNKTRRIDVKVTAEQFDALNQKAAAQSMNLSEFMLFCGMNAKISVNIGKLTALDTFEYEMSFLKRMRDGGEITAAYQLDFNCVVVSYNEFYISVKEK